MGTEEGTGEPRLTDAEVQVEKGHVQRLVCVEIDYAQSRERKGWGAIYLTHMHNIVLAHALACLPLVVVEARFGDRDAGRWGLEGAPSSSEAAPDARRCAAPRRRMPTGLATCGPVWMRGRPWSEKCGFARHQEIG